MEHVARILQIDRSNPFNYTNFVRSTLPPKYAKHSVETHFTSTLDKNSLALEEIDLNSIELVNHYPFDNRSLRGRIKTLNKRGYLCLDAKIFEMLWNDKRRIPRHWKEKIDGEITRIHFDGTRIFSFSRYGGIYSEQVMQLYFANGGWRESWRDGNTGMSKNEFSAVLKKSTSN